ncbi:MAG: hypothetical protein HFH60_03340 [Lachnospiraceae bacterium]|nr:hypothetical protein [Lachnospiraceae bacterium]MCI9545713.1 hypothetical protein [Lachnospiraceae bacterium]
MKNKFLMCGSIGWCMEIFWTGIHCLEQRDFTLMGHSSIWMFPIYGMAAVIGPVSRHLKDFPALWRGSIYTVGIYFMEFTTGSLLSKLQICPWDYSQAALNYKGLIRLDYAPLWFLAGLFFEKILSDNS